MRTGQKVRAAIGVYMVALLGLPATAWATHNIAVVGGPPKFDFALIMLGAAPYLIVGTFALVIWRKYRQQR